MPIIKSAKKALKVAARRKIENDLTRSKVKSAVKGVRIALKSGEKQIEAKLSDAYKQLDLAAKKHVIHKNKASRLKSRLAKSLTAEVAGKPVKSKKN